MRGSFGRINGIFTCRFSVLIARARAIAHSLSPTLYDSLGVTLSFSLFFFVLLLVSLSYESAILKLLHRFGIYREGGGSVVRGTWVWHEITSVPLFSALGDAKVSRVEWIMKVLSTRCCSIHRSLEKRRARQRL